MPVGRVYIEEATRLFHEVSTNNKGRVVYLAGAQSSGKTTLLMDLAEVLSQQTPSPIILVGGTAEKWKKFLSRCPVPVQNVVNGIGGLMSGVGTFSATLDSGVTQAIGQSLQTLVQGKELYESVLSGGEDQEKVFNRVPKLKQMIRELCQHHPVVWIIDDIHETTGSVWCELLRTLAEEISCRLPALVVVSVEGPEDLTSHGESSPALFSSAKKLIQLNLAEWWYIKPLTQKGINEWIGGGTGEVVDLLYSVTGGNPGYVTELWEYCKKQCLVVKEYPDGVWRFGEDSEVFGEKLLFPGDILRRTLKGVLGINNEITYELACDVLACGTYEGEEFTGEAIGSLILNKKTNGSLEDIMDLIDTYLLRTTERPDGILKLEKSIRFTSAPDNATALSRYSFCSKLVWHIVNQIAVMRAERINESYELTQILLKLYDLNPEFVYETVARLFRQGNDEVSAIHYQRLADIQGESLTLSLQIAILYQQDTSMWEDWEFHRGLRMLQAIWRRGLHFIYLDKQLELGKIGVMWAKKVGNLYEEVQFSRLHGYTLLKLGRHSDARSIMTHCFIQNELLQDQQQQCHLFAALANLELNSDNLSAAEQYARYGLEIAERIGYVWAIGVCNKWLGHIERHKSNYKLSNECWEKSVQNFRMTNDFNELSETLVFLGESKLYLRNAYQAIEAILEGLNVARTSGIKRTEVMAWGKLGRIFYVFYGKLNLAIQCEAVGLQTLLSHSKGKIIGEQNIQTISNFGFILKLGGLEDGYLLEILAGLLFGKEQEFIFQEIKEKDIVQQSIDRGFTINEIKRVDTEYESLSKERFMTMYEEVDYEYQNDGGKTLIENILKTIPMLDVPDFDISAEDILRNVNQVQV